MAGDRAGKPTNPNIMVQHHEHQHQPPCSECDSLGRAAVSRLTLTLRVGSELIYASGISEMCWSIGCFKDKTMAFSNLTWTTRRPGSVYPLLWLFDTDTFFKDIESRDHMASPVFSNGFFFFSLPPPYQKFVPVLSPRWPVLSWRSVASCHFPPAEDGCLA